MVDTVTKGQFLNYQLILVMHLNIIFHDYALVKTPRDLIFGMSTQMTDRNDIRYINLHSLVIKGHKRSQKVT